MTVTPEELFAYICGGPVDDDLLNRMRLELANHDSEASQTVQAVSASAASMFEIDWAALVEMMGESVKGSEEGFTAAEYLAQLRQRYASADNRGTKPLPERLRLTFAEQLAVAQAAKPQPDRQLLADLSRVGIELSPRQLKEFKTGLQTPAPEVQAAIRGMFGEHWPRQGRPDLQLVAGAPGDQRSGDLALRGPRTRPRLRDIEQELADFVDLDLAREMVALWQGDRDQRLEEWLQTFGAKCADPYRRELVRTLAYTSLLKAHVKARGPVDRLVQLAADNLPLQADALYLQGRQRWYVREASSALETLLIAKRLSVELGNDVRTAQCLLYLSRLGAEFADQLESSPSHLLEHSLELAESAGRADIRLLSKRALLEQDRRSIKNYVQIARELTSLIEEGEACADMDMSYILDSVRVDLGLAYRRLGTERARVDAERLYDEMIARPRDDSHRGMCLYLKADLYVDRMGLAAAMYLRRLAAGNAEEAAEWLAEARDSYDRVVQLCEQSSQELSQTYDQAAQAKVLFRIRVFRDRVMELPKDSRDAVLTLATREFHLNDLLYGSGGLTDLIAQLSEEPSEPEDTRVAYSPILAGMSKQKFEQLLGHFFRGTLIPRTPADEPGQVRIDDYLRTGSVISLPILSTNTGALEIRVFSRSLPKGSTEERVGFKAWLSIESYSGQIRPLLEEYVSEYHDRLIERRGEVIGAVNSKIETVHHLGDKPGSADFVIIAIPRANAEWLCPIEWLHSRNPATGAPGPSLIELAHHGLLFTTGQRSPFLAVDVQLAGDAYQFYASRQPFQQTTMNQLSADSIGATVHPFHLGERLAPKSSGVMVFAHADKEGLLADTLRTWDFAACQAVVLLFCSSGHHQFVTGPFYENLAVSIRNQMDSHGIVVGSRVPVEPDELFRFATWVREHSDAPLASVVLDYLKARQSANPFEVPWIVLA